MSTLNVFDKPRLALVVPIKTWFRAKSEAALVWFFSWALSKRSVQQVIVDTFDGSTPMCRVFERVLESRSNIDANNIPAIESIVEEALDNFDVESITDAVIENLISKLR